MRTPSGNMALRRRCGAWGATMKIAALVAVVACSSVACGPVEEADVVDSVFPARRRVRPAVAPLASTANAIEVATADELFAALTSLPRADGACYGRSIVVVADLQFTSPVVLDAQHAGLTITSPSFAVISAPATASPWMTIDTADVTVDSLTLGADFEAPTAFSSTTTNAKNLRISGLVIASGSGVTLLLNPSTGIGGGLKILDNRVSSTSMTVALINNSTDGDIDQGDIRGNVNFTGANALGAFSRSVLANNIRLGQWATVFSTGATGRSTYSANVMEGDILLNDDGANAVVGNTMNGNDINTTGAAGAADNTVVANTTVGVITVNAGDVSASNT